MLLVNHIIICSTSLQNQKSCGVIRRENVLDCFGLVKFAAAEDVCRSSLGQVSFFHRREFVQRDLQCVETARHCKTLWTNLRRWKNVD